MKSKLILILIFLWGICICGCEDELGDYVSISNLDGLSLYWDHEVFGDGGRRLRFEFYGTDEFENDYELKFKYIIHRKTISIRLVNIIDAGKCPSFPGMDPLCSPRGGLSIPDDQLNIGTYTLNLETPYFETNSELIVDNEKITLKIPPNKHFSSSINEVYPIPPNLLFGSVVYSGDENSQYAEDFFNDLLNLGLTKTKLPNYPYRHLSVDEEGNAIERHWEPDNHSIGFIYKMNNNFKDIFKLAKKHFKKSNINIYLYSSQGDQGLMNKNDGITVVFAD